MSMSPSSLARGANASANAAASSRVLFIFQFAATSGRREPSGIVESLHAGHLAALEQFKRGAATRGEPVDLVGEPDVGQRPPRSAAANHRLAPRGSDRLGDAAGSRREW